MRSEDSQFPDLAGNMPVSVLLVAVVLLSGSSANVQLKDVAAARHPRPSRPLYETGETSEKVT